jgi:hypothetical protein
VRYLGHVVSEDGVSTDPEKTAAVDVWPVPRCIKDLQSFLGTVGYYRQFVPDFATTAKPLTILTGKDVKWKWGREEQEAFDALKQKLVTAPVLGYPDPTLPDVLDTDASAHGIGAVLSQEQEGKERVIGYYSKTLGDSEQTIV